MLRFKSDKYNTRADLFLQTGLLKKGKQCEKSKLLHLDFVILKYLYFFFLHGHSLKHFSFGQVLRFEISGKNINYQWTYAIIPAYTIYP